MSELRNCEKARLAGDFLVRFKLLDQCFDGLIESVRLVVGPKFVF